MLIAQEWLDEWYPINGTCRREGHGKGDWKSREYQQLFSNYGKRRGEITHLDISSEELIGKLDFSEFPQLTWLYCYKNHLTEIDLFNNKELNHLFCFINQFRELILDNNSQLVQLNCASNQLNSLNLLHLTKLERFWCFSNQLNKLELSNNEKLRNLFCGNNQLRGLNIEKNVNLTRLSCESNQIQELNLINQTELIVLNCSSNEIFLLNVDNNNKLKYLDCWENRLTSLNLNKINCLISLNCKKNNLSSLNLTNQTKLTNLFFDWTGKVKIIRDAQTWLNDNYHKDGTCQRKEATTGKFKGWKNGEEKLYSNFGKGREEITHLDISNKNLTGELDLTDFPNLIELDCGWNKLTYLNLTKLYNLVKFYCYSNNLSSLNLTNQTKLTCLNCSENQLTSLDLTNQIKLERLSCRENKFISILDLSNSTQLTDLSLGRYEVEVVRDAQKWLNDNYKKEQRSNINNLDISDKNLTGQLELSDFPNLVMLNCCKNQLTQIDLTNQAQLKKLYCSENRLQQLTIYGKTKLTRLGCSENQLTKLNLIDQTELTEIYFYQNQFSRFDFLLDLNSKILSKFEPDWNTRNFLESFLQSEVKSQDDESLDLDEVESIFEGSQSSTATAIRVNFLNLVSLLNENLDFWLAFTLFRFKVMAKKIPLEVIKEIEEWCGLTSSRKIKQLHYPYFQRYLKSDKYVNEEVNCLFQQI
jgi:hypothetical protein